MQCCCDIMTNISNHIKDFKEAKITDTHYFENSLGAGGKAFEKNMLTEQYLVKESSDIVKTTFFYNHRYN